MLKVTISHNFAQALKALDGVSERRLRTVLATTLTRTAFATRAGVQSDLPREIDKPSAYTVRGLRYSRATPATLTAEVFWPDTSTGRATPQAWYLGRLVRGGQRGQKRYERALTLRGILPQGWVAVPGPAADLDAGGGITAAQVRMVLAGLRQAPQTNNARKRQTAKTGGVFAVTQQDGGLRPGVYVRRGGSAQAVLFFVQQANYTARTLNLPRIASGHAAKAFPREFERALGESLARLRARGG